MSRIARTRAKRLATPPTARRRDTAAQLRHTAVRLIERDGLASVSVNRLCREAGFTRGAFYSSYRDFDHLLAEVIAERFTALDTVLNHAGGDVGGAASDEAGAQEMLTKAAADIGLALPLDRGFYILREELILYGIRHPAIAKLMNDYEERLVEEVTGLIERVLSGTGYRLTLPARTVASHILSVSERLYRHLLLQHHHDRRLTRSEIAQTARETVPPILRAVSIYAGSDAT